ncbi:MAG: hypothetical protein OEW06_11515 [Gemmatimonadota bacterium]|nr:hypothetical protein [Gemmatimonadota bacterium]
MTLEREVAVHDGNLRIGPEESSEDLVLAAAIDAFVVGELNHQYLRLAVAEALASPGEILPDIGYLSQ